MKQRPFSCEHCDDRFKNKSHLKQHRLSTHNPKGTPFHCTHPNCDRQYKRESGLRDHVKFDHEGHSPPHKCDFPGCSRTFPQSTNCANHRLSHSGAKPHKCPECGKSVQSKGSLTKHLKIHEKNNLRAAKRYISASSHTAESLAWLGGKSQKNTPTTSSGSSLVAQDTHSN